MVSIHEAIAQQVGTALLIVRERLGSHLLAVAATVGDAVVDRHHHLVELRGQVQAAHDITHVRRHRGRHTRNALEDGSVGHHDVEDDRSALSVILGARVGNDLNALDAAGRHRLEQVLGIVLERRVGMAVAEDSKIGLTVDTNLFLTVNTDQRHLAQHGEHIVGLTVGISLNIVANAVHLLLDELTLGGDLNALELDVVKRVKQRVGHPIIVVTRRLHFIARHVQRHGVAHDGKRSLEGVALEFGLIDTAALWLGHGEFVTLERGLGRHVVELLHRGVHRDSDALAVLLDVDDQGHRLRSGNHVAAPSAVVVLCHSREAREHYHNHTQ